MLFRRVGFRHRDYFDGTDIRSPHVHLFRTLRSSTTQLQRLTLTPTGRDLLLRLGYISQLQDVARRKSIPDHLRTTYKVAPIPRNMDPRLHQGHREALVEALEREHGHKNTTYYVDAANYDLANTKAVATVVNHTFKERTSASVRCHNITEAEETAIALALALGYRHQRSLTVLTDSQAACRNYLKGRISQPALNILLNATDTGEHSSTRPPDLASDHKWIEQLLRDNHFLPLPITPHRMRRG
ncbi:hypothetical protein HPB52_014970 [Rhipicephalus sanguineus]|uniref:Uncharacterized protein n=1 Tax=Rhipicephalus sanguineus TaxID=34632 RepID=A0A9D4TAK5_RHISA|nr:hypothetical protein HPB52_014970 [Rhipicephalus sanguineus]